MANHRAERQPASRIDDVAGSPASEPVRSAPGKRRAEKPSRGFKLSRSAKPAAKPAVPAVAQAVVEPVAKPIAKAAAGARRRLPEAPAARGTRQSGRKKLFPLLPSTPTAVGAVALAVAAAGAVTAGQDSTQTVASEGVTKLYTQASVLTGTTETHTTSAASSRQRAVSRDSQREALQDAAAEQLLAAAEAQAKERNAALAQLAASAEKYAAEIAANAWVLPLDSYDLTARFGESSGLWASTHTGLDFAAPYGAPVKSVARGTVTSTEYAGSYGNRVIVTLEDGTEIWYCHLTAFTASPGESVDPGEQIGTVGSTGNSTGAHLHLEVRPGAGDAVDPYAALVAHGVQP